MGKQRYMKTINYIIPDMNNHGGVQRFAKDAAGALKKSNNYKANIHSWQFTVLPLFLRGTMRFAPTWIGSLLYLVIAKPYFNKRYDFSKTFNHFWEIESAIPYQGSNYVVTVHGLDILPKSRRGFRNRAYLNVLKNANLIHANSNFTKDLILQTYPEISSEKIVVITPHINVRMKKKLRKAKPLIKVGTLTRLVQRKNVQGIIEALAIINSQSDINFEFILAGDGPEKDRILSALKGASFKWKYLGKISDEYKDQKFFPDLDVFIMPPLALQNDIEGFGIVFIEANNYGVPVIASDTGGISDAVSNGESGLFANPNDPQDIARKTIEVIQNLDSFQRTSQKWVRNFDYSKMVKKLEKLYERAFG
jgi:glycosyltransferase involved in cell wall biosynthesis